MGSNIIKYLSTFVVILAFLLSGCWERKPINYSELNAEELEILYQNGREQLLQDVCEAYARWYLERPETEWWIEGVEYKKKDGEKLLHYCSKSFKIHKNKHSACYLKSYYQSLAESGEIYLAEFIFYLKYCGNDNAYRAFIEKDSRVSAIADHSLGSLKYLAGSKDPNEFLSRIKKVSALFRQYINDFKQIENEVALFSGQINDLIIVFEGISKTLENMDRVLTQIKVTSKDVSTAKSYFEEVLWHINTLEGDLTKFLDIVVKVNSSLSSTESLNKDLILDVKDTIEEFKKRRDTWISNYDGYLEGSKG